VTADDPARSGAPTGHDFDTRRTLVANVIQHRKPRNIRKDEREMADLNQIAETLSSLTVMEAAELATLLEEKWGVSAAAPVAIAAGGGAAAPAAAAVEQTEFNVILTGFGDKKIQVIKEVRAITGLGLKEAKDLVEGVPKPIKEGVTKDEAAGIKKQIEEAGGQADIK
jgi:large subunit ribosomal protein L7/L12